MRMVTVNRRTIVLLALLVVPLFYAVSTGFDFLYTLLYAVLLLFVVGAAWAWVNLRGLELRVSRSGDRGQVGGYLEGRVTIVNHTMIPKSWLEVTELAGPRPEDGPPQPGGRGLSLDRRQTRSWRIDTYLSRRGLFEGGHMRVVSQDPFGLFRMARNYSDPHTYIVYPAIEPLPHLDVRFAGLPADSRLTRYFDQVTTDASSLRPWRPGDAYRRIHWPYTARMNSPMVKEFDVGMAAQFWVLLDLDRRSHFYPPEDAGDRNRNGARPGPESDDTSGDLPQFRADNTEELAVTLAASLSQRMMEMSLPVGMAVNGENGTLLRPDHGPDHLSRMMETLASARAAPAPATAPLPEFLHSLRSQLNHFHSVTVVTSNTDPAWLPALLELKRVNVTISITLVDPASFGGQFNTNEVVNAAAAELVPVYVATRDGRLDDALSRPVNRESIESLEPAAIAGAGLFSDSPEGVEQAPATAAVENPEEKAG